LCYKVPRGNFFALNPLWLHVYTHLVHSFWCTKKAVPVHDSKILGEQTWFLKSRGAFIAINGVLPVSLFHRRGFPDATKLVVWRSHINSVSLLQVCWTESLFRRSSSGRSQSKTPQTPSENASGSSGVKHLPILFTNAVIFRHEASSFVRQSQLSALEHPDYLNGASIFGRFSPQNHAYYNPPRTRPWGKDSLDPHLRNPQTEKSNNPLDARSQHSMQDRAGDMKYRVAAFQILLCTIRRGHPPEHSTSRQSGGSS